MHHPSSRSFSISDGHWIQGEPASVMNVRFQLEELDAKLR